METRLPFFQLCTAPPATPPEQILWIIFSGSSILVRTTPQQTPFGDCIFPISNGTNVGLQTEGNFCIGMYRGVSCYAALAVKPVLSAEYRLVSLRALFSEVEESLWYAAGRAFQILEWNKTTRYCGKCGKETEQMAGEYAKQCAGCGFLQYPRVTPAIIVLIQRFDRGEPHILLTRSVRFPGGMYSVQAGFVEAGESLEEAVHREIEEETGIRVQNLRYFGSQSWPFPHSLMIAFIADYHSGELKLDPTELTDGDWYPRSALPPIPPRISIAREMINFAFADDETL